MKNKKMKELYKLSKPLVEWLKENFNLYSSIEINFDSINVKINELSIPILDDKNEIFEN